MLREEEISYFLPGCTADMPKEFAKLAEIFRYDAFELLRDEAGEACVSYMMNDLVENYLILKNCQIEGEYNPKAKYTDDQKLRIEEGRYALSIRQDLGKTCTIWFDGIEEKMAFFQYHNIGHFWRSGEEQWRQMVYIIGTIYDKYQYLGETYCNEMELELIRLMEFEPFIYWSPIKESLKDYYLPTKEGTEYIKSLCQQTGCVKLKRAIEKYEAEPSPFFEKILQKTFQDPESEALYQLIRQKVEQASLPYPERDYGAAENVRIKEERRKVSEELKKEGYEGEYPLFYKEKETILAAEEHPFIKKELEYEKYEFKIRLMVSEVADPKENHINSGFFQGEGRKGFIR